MSNYTDKTTANPALEDFASALEQVLHKGAQDMLQVAIEIEVQQYTEKHQKELDENAHRIVVRNGYLPERELLTGIGPVKVKQPRIDDRKLRKKSEGTEGFSSRIIPRYLRRIPSIDNLIPALYLKGISTNDFPQALSAILGKEAVRRLSYIMVRGTPPIRSKNPMCPSRKLSRSFWGYARTSNMCRFVQNFV